MFTLGTKPSSRSRGCKTAPEGLAIVTAYTARDGGWHRWPHWPGGSTSWPYIVAAQDLVLNLVF